MSDQPQATTWHGPRTIGVMLALRQNPQEKHVGYLDIYQQGDTLAVYVLGLEVEGFKYRVELGPNDRRWLSAILLDMEPGPEDDYCPTCRAPVGPGVPHHHTGRGEPQ